MKEIKVKNFGEVPYGYTGIVVFPRGPKYWYKKGKLHNENGPAIVNPNGTKKWWLNGELHNENGPAVVNPNGTKEWYLNGKLHNENGPAIVNPDGTKEWWVNGEELTKPEFILRTCKLIKVLNERD